MKKCAKLSIKEVQELKHLIKTGDDTKEVRRAQAVLLINSETSFEIIESLTQFKQRAVLEFRRRYLAIGLKGLEHRSKGKPKRLLTTAQRAEILEMLTEKSPTEEGYESEYWTTSILSDVIRNRYGVVYKTRKPFYLLFEDAKLSFHKPGQVYERHDELKVTQWKKDIESRLINALNDPETVILCEDEMILSSKTTFQKIWLKKGEYPKIHVSNTRKNKSIYGFLNIQSARCHAFVRDYQNMHITTEILKEIRCIYPQQKIVLFWDGAGWHRGSVVQEFVRLDGNIEIVYFPPYSPAENPQEHVWKQGRSAITHNVFIPNVDIIAKQFIDYLNEASFPYKLLNFAARS